MNKIGKRILIGILLIAFLCSAAANIIFIPKAMKANEIVENDEIWNIHFPDTNSRDTYFSIHNMNKVHEVSQGDGIKVGILDWGFGYEEHEGLYAGGKDFSTWEYHEENFLHANEHGFWMAQTLKEIAPKVQVYALGSFNPDSEKDWVDTMIKAIEWAMEEKLDILTLSHQKLSKDNRERFDEAVNKAIQSGIVTTFIHYDNPNNILPWGIWSGEGEGYNRVPDINIFQYDYNTIFLENYAAVIENKDFDSTYKSELNLSISSMSVVTAGFVAILKEINNTLTPKEYKDILVKTSRPMEYEGDNAEHVVDMENAVNYMLEHYK